MEFNSGFKGLKAELNPICHLLALLGAHHNLHVSRIRVKILSQLLFLVVNTLLLKLRSLIDVIPSLHVDV